ncbi:MAG TPA: pyruvate formate lyase family protein [Candidatus Diapherotrites archaeon]|nr:pyruvate formate lyase family protein [Candidatus Diapherotrites archaeon]
MNINHIYTGRALETAAKALFAEERRIKRLDGWFLVNEITQEVFEQYPDKSEVEKRALAQLEVARRLPLFISKNAVFAGTQRDAFAKSYALINPNFKVSTFNGYCDPTAVYDDIEPNEEFTAERIEKVRNATKNSTYVRHLSKVYEEAEADTCEVAYFIEQVTGHVIPDFRYALQNGLEALIEQLERKMTYETAERRRNQYNGMKMSLEAALILAERYQKLALELAGNGSEDEKRRFTLMADTLAKVPRKGASTLYEAVQSFIILWQAMCLEQAPNPFAFSVGNADRIFEPYRAKEGLSRELAAGLFMHFLVFFNVGDRSWAISQNILIGGRDVEGNDLSNLCSYALLDAYYSMNLPQPILSVKLHENTPDEMYGELGRFLFSPGCLTPSFFNDDALFKVLEDRGVERDDLADYSVAGCQEPLIMGKDNGNTTNSWLNLGKILELTLNSGKSAISGKQICSCDTSCETNEQAAALLSNIRELYYKNVDYFMHRMAKAANGACEALSHLPVPFLSVFMGGLQSGIDMRDVNEQGTKYNGSGCLIHGLSVVADSFIAIDKLLEERPQDALRLLNALKSDFSEDEELRQYLLDCDKFGNNLPSVDQEAVNIASCIAEKVASLKNYLGNPFRPDFSTPSTHLLYGYWVGATPDGRHAREQLNYGVDPLFGSAENGLGFRVLSARKLPYDKFYGGYASHLGLDPKYFRGATYEEKGLEFKNKILRPLFFSQERGTAAPFYLYVNVATPEILRKVLQEPKKYAPSGVYIMRIHGTFVNFLDLSPEIQQDIIKRLDLKSTVC